MTLIHSRSPLFALSKRILCHVRNNIACSSIVKLYLDIWPHWLNLNLKKWWSVISNIMTNRRDWKKPIDFVITAHDCIPPVRNIQNNHNSVWVYPLQRCKARFFGTVAVGNVHMKRREEEEEEYMKVSSWECRWTNIWRLIITVENIRKSSIYI